MTNPPVTPLPLSPYDAAVGLPARADALLDASESEVLHVVDATLAQYGPLLGLYQLASWYGAEILRRTNAITVHITNYLTRDRWEPAYRFLRALWSELHQKPTGEGSMEALRIIMEQSGEYAGRKLVCSLLTIARAMRRGIDRSLGASA